MTATESYDLDDRYLADDIAAIQQLVCDRSIIGALSGEDMLPGFNR